MSVNVLIFDFLTYLQLKMRSIRNARAAAIASTTILISFHVIVSFIAKPAAVINAKYPMVANSIQVYRQGIVLFIVKPIISNKQIIIAANATAVKKYFAVFGSSSVTNTTAVIQHTPHIT